MYILYTYISTYCDIYGFNLCGGRFLCWSNGWKTKREKKISNSLKEQITIIIIIITKKAGCMQFLTCTYIMLFVFIDFVRDIFKNRMDRHKSYLSRVLRARCRNEYENIDHWHLLNPTFMQNIRLMLSVN